MKQLSLIFTLLTALIVATNTHAHTGLESSVPSNNTMLMESLEEIEDGRRAHGVTDLVVEGLDLRRGIFILD